MRNSLQSTRLVLALSLIGLGAPSAGASLPPETLTHVVAPIALAPDNVVGIVLAAAAVATEHAQRAAVAQIPDDDPPAGQVLHEPPSVAGQRRAAAGGAEAQVADARDGAGGQRVAEAIETARRLRLLRERQRRGGEEQRDGSHGVSPRRARRRPCAARRR